MAATYFELFDENAFDPDADAQTMDADFSYLEYKPPPGNDFLISSDTRIEPSRQRGEAGSVVRPRRQRSAAGHRGLPHPDLALGAGMEIVYRAALLYLFLFFMMRVLGKKELGQMSAFELVLLLAMGDLVQQGVTQEDYSVTGAMLAIGTFGVLILCGSYVTFRFPRTRPALEGIPVVVVRDGRLNEKVMHLERLDRHRGARGTARAGHR